MDKKQNNEFLKIIIFFCLCIVFLIGAILLGKTIKSRKNNIQQNNYQYSQNVEDIRNDNVSLYEDTGEIDDIEDFPCKVFVQNSDFWYSETNLSSYAIASFNLCAEQYLQKNTETYPWHVYLSEFHSNYMAPFFFMTIGEYPDKKYKCIWNENKKGYAFIEMD